MVEAELATPAGQSYKLSTEARVTPDGPPAQATARKLNSGKAHSMIVARRLSVGACIVGVPRSKHAGAPESAFSYDYGGLPRPSLADQAELAALDPAQRAVGADQDVVAARPHEARRLRPRPGA